MSVYVNVMDAECEQAVRLHEGVKELNTTVSGQPLILVSRDGYLVSPVDGNNLRRLTVDSLATLARATAIPGRYKKSEEDPSDLVFVPQPKLPRDLVRSYIEGGAWSGLPVVNSVATAPLVRPDFTVRWETGWDEATSTWVMPGVAEDRSLIGTDLRGLFTEFSLVDRRLEADCLAAALTPLLANAISGALPGFIVTAPKPSSGKSELAQLMARIGGAGGDTLTRWPSRDEFTKTVSAFVAESEGVVIFDNIKSRMDSPDLESVITSRRTSFRAMFSHTTQKLHSDTSWFFTVNGAHVSTDILRRCIVVLLDTERHPTTWTGRVPTESRRHEAALVTLLVSLVESWRDAGCPAGSVVHPGFEAWSQTVSGVLEHAGIQGMWEARADVIGEAIAVDGEEDGEILDRISALMGGSEFTSAELWERASDWATGSPILKEFLRSARSAGANLRPLRGQTFEGCPYRLDFRQSNGKRLWQTVRIDGQEVRASAPEAHSDAH